MGKKLKQRQQQQNQHFKILSFAACFKSRNCFIVCPLSSFLYPCHSEYCVSILEGYEGLAEQNKILGQEISGFIIGQFLGNF